MRMKTTVGIIAVLTVLAMLATACGGGGGTVSAGEVKTLFKDMISHAETFIASIEKAESVSDVTDAINELADNMEGIIPKVKEMANKSPDLLASADPELKQLQQKLMTTFTSLAPKMQQKIPSLMGTGSPDDLKDLMKAAKRLEKIGKAFMEIGG